MFFFHIPHLRGTKAFFVVVRGLTRWVMILCVAFGLTFGPLLWRRPAALSARSAQSLMAPWVGSSGCKFPWTIRYSSRQDLVSEDCDSSLLYLCSGRLWASTWIGRRTREATRVEWIGGEFDVLRVQLTEAKTQAAKDNIDELVHGQAVKPVNKIVSFMRYTSWIASDAPEARPLVSMLWGALTDHAQWTPQRDTTRKRHEKLGFFCRKHF